VRHRESWLVWLRHVRHARSCDTTVESTPHYSRVRLYSLNLSGQTTHGHGCEACQDSKMVIAVEIASDRGPILRSPGLLRLNGFSWPCLAMAGPIWGEQCPPVARCVGHQARRRAPKRPVGPRPTDEHANRSTSGFPMRRTRAGRTAPRQPQPDPRPASRVSERY
jgi:hypothetical protein